MQDLLGRDQFLESINLVKVVDNKTVNPFVVSATKFVVRFVVPVHNDALRGNTGAKNNVHLAFRRDINVETFFHRESRHGATQERFRSKRDTVAENLCGFLTTCAKRRFVVDKQRCAKFFGKLGQRDATNQGFTVRQHRRIW